jgi:ubiquinone/menaquinone biosynthesis C-methylase UbiE
MGDRERAELLNILESWHANTIAEQQHKMSRLLANAPKLANKEDSGRGTYKAKEIIEQIGTFKPKTILDIGSGTGDVITALAGLLKLDDKHAYGLSMVAVNPSKFYTPIHYKYDKEKGNVIPLDDSSIDLIVFAQVLHHIHPEERKKLLIEAKRVLSKNGLIVIQEHDYNNDMYTYLSLDVLHTFWYVKYEETTDPLYLMSISQTRALFEEVGFVSNISKPYPKGWQRMYWDKYSNTKVKGVNKIINKYLMSTEYNTLLMEREKIGNVYIPFDNMDLYITSKNKTLSYHERHRRNVGTESVDWGQLKLLVCEIQALVSYWDKNELPELRVVYAGAAPGHHFGILSDMFPSIIWELYDIRDFTIYSEIRKNKGRINIHKKLFTNKIAEYWAQYDNIFFFSDIRSVDYKKHQGEALEKLILEDMIMQSGWVKIMNPYRASLKFRLPYILSETSAKTTNYLDGNIMIQCFSKGNSTETRLIPIRDSSTGKYYDKSYNNEHYESVMFYHNSIIREQALYLYDMVADGKINDPSGLDNHYDSINFLRVLDMYKQFSNLIEFQIPTIELAIRICEELGSYRKNPATTIASLRERNIKRKEKELTLELLKEKFPKGMIQCYTSSMRMQKFTESILQCSNAGSIKLNTAESLIDFLKNDYNSVNVELTLFTRTKYSDAEKTNILQKYNLTNTNIGNFLANRKQKSLRLFVHAWNIFKIKESYIIASSWYNIRDYEITHTFKNREEYLLFLDNLEKAINNFTKEPKVLYELFGLDQTKIIASGINKLFPLLTELKQPYIIDSLVTYV